MSYTIITNVFCDNCGGWDSKTGGAVGAHILKQEAWNKARSVGWRKFLGKHRCAKCELERLEDQLGRTNSLEESSKWKKNIVDGLTREIDLIRRQSGILF